MVPAVAEENPEGFATWAPAMGRMLGALGFAAAALLPERRLARPRRSLALGIVWTAAAVGLVAVVAALFGDDLPRGSRRPSRRRTRRSPRIEGHALVLSGHLAILLFYSAATVGFLRRAEQKRDVLLLWVAVASALAAIARLDYFLFPTLYSEWVYVGDIIRLLSYIALLVGVSRELLGLPAPGRGCCDLRGATASRAGAP